MLSIQWKVPEREPPNGGPDAENACEASGTHALRVQVGGGAPTPRGFPRGDKSTRSVPPRQGHAFHAMESSRKGDEMLLFAACKK